MSKSLLFRFWTLIGPLLRGQCAYDTISSFSDGPIKKWYHLVRAIKCSVLIGPLRCNQGRQITPKSKRNYRVRSKHEHKGLYFKRMSSMSMQFIQSNLNRNSIVVILLKEILYLNLIFRST